MKRVSIVGLGYIGLPTAILAAKSGCEVFGFDTDHDKVDKINSGDSTILEPELSDKLWNVLSKTTFKAYKDLQFADCFLVAVPTPFNKDRTADLSYVFKASDLIAQRIMPGNLVILESTVPVGTTEKVAARIASLSGLRLGVDFFVAYCPERVLPGKIFKELVENDRVIGGTCQRACELARLFYSKFVKGFLHITDHKVAEMVKLIENSSRDVQIAFANQVAAMCQEAEIDPFQVIELANRHPRVKLLSPGCGVGGHCIAVDPYFLIEQFPHATRLLHMAREVNENKPKAVIEEVLLKARELQELGVSRPKVLTLGITFKADVDDIRESPALKIASALSQRKDLFDVHVYDRNVSVDIQKRLGLDTCPDLEKGLMEADIIVILVKHKEFALLGEMAFHNKIIVDPCGLLHDIYNRESQDMLNGTVMLNKNFSSRAEQL